MHKRRRRKDERGLVEKAQMHEHGYYLKLRNDMRQKVGSLVVVKKNQ